MPIKQHIVKVGENNTIQIPKSICSAMGIAEGVYVKLYSEKTGSSFTVKTLVSDELAFENDRLQAEVERLKQELQKFKQ